MIVVYKLSVSYFILILIWFCDNFRSCLSENVYSTPIDVIDYHAKNGFFDQGQFYFEAINIYLRRRSKKIIGRKVCFYI